MQPGKPARIQIQENWKHNRNNDAYTYLTGFKTDCSQIKTLNNP